MIKYDEIESIESVGEQDFYDLEVPDTHCYFAHGILNHNSGKDRTISKIQLYVVYKLMCMKDPQKTLREVYGCSIGHGDAIDIGNMSINARQAVNVYFKKFKQMLKAVRSPATGKNWFAEKGVDLRDGYDVQSAEVRFPMNITAHSLNGETNTGEGLTLFFVTIDEFGSFPAEKAFDLLDAARDTVESRFTKYGKVCVISYKYNHNDPMDTLYNKEKNNPEIYTSKASTWEVMVNREKSDFARKYLQNPEKAKMTYECEGGIEEGGYVTKKYMLEYMFDGMYVNPVQGDLVSVDGSYLHALKFNPKFRGVTGRIYAVHVDMAKGKVEEKGDAAGLALAHCELMTAKIDADLKRELIHEGIILPDTFSEKLKGRKGVVIDLALQLIAKKRAEIEFADVRKFILFLRDVLKFNIRFVTFDGWQSVESIQVLKYHKIVADVLSVDRNNEAYDLWKELMYQQLMKCYPHPIARREARELITADNGKIDHPEKSWDREVMEGIDKGSKDVMDAIAGVTKNSYDRISISPTVFFG